MRKNKLTKLSSMMNCKNGFIDLCKFIGWGICSCSSICGLLILWKESSSRLQLNPGLQPMRGYFNFPVAGSFQRRCFFKCIGN